jgi:tetratricopeptide (TPR) repeat protein
MVGDPQQSRATRPGTASLAVRCDDVELHRVDLAARVLALKHPTLAADALIERTAAEARRDHGEFDAALFIAEMIRVGPPRCADDDAARPRLAGERLAELLAALDDAADAVVLRGICRRGELARPLPLSALRRIRRTCLQLHATGAAATTSEPLATPLWDGLLDTLAGSLALDDEAELWSDVGLDGLGAAALTDRRERVREAIVRGERAERRTLPLRDDPSTHITLATHAAPVWPPPARELLPPGHRVGRFTLLHRLGVGAMGVVYAAYDPELDRRIAVKLLRARQGSNAARAQARLLREAQAMARLAHPNVAVVHDVGTHEGDVFVAMEFIRGDTLQSWLRQRPRTWQEVVEVFVQAGRGLAAAHAAGLVHRDFKPSNAMIGDDGRVRVLDFGLCYTANLTDSIDGPRSDTRPDTRSAESPRITRHEEIVGTPAYMPPEQARRGGLVGPASDQFSFCASLYEALHGQLPFAGQTVPAIALAIASGELRPPPRASKVPGWLHAVVQRGLRVDPTQRHAAMDLLLRALDRSRVRARRGVAIAAALALGTGFGGFWAARSEAFSADPCTGGAAQITEVWGPTQLAEAAQSLAAAGPAFAEDIWPRVEGVLDRYAEDWQANHREACQAHRSGETSGALLDRRMACLEQRKAALHATVTVLAEAEPDVALHALEVVAHLPSLARCNDRAALEADAAPPDDPEVRAALARERPRIDRVRALEHAGLGDAARTLAEQIVETAVALGDRRLLAESLLARGRLEINRLGSHDDQDALLTRAYLSALGGRLDELAVEALALRMYVRSRNSGGAAQALDDLAVAREMLARQPSPGPVRGLLLNNAGVVYMAGGDPLRAAALFREALAAREATLGPEHLEVAFTLANLAMVSPADERVPLLQRALAIFDQTLGRAHPQTIEVRLAASFYALDPREAQALVAPGCEALGRFSPDDQAQRARCLAHLGHHTAEAGDAQAAAAAFAEAVAVLPHDLEGLHLTTIDVAQIHGRAALYSGEHRPAIDRLRDQLAALGGDDWWQREQRAELLLLLGLHLERLGDREGAGAALGSAIREFSAVASSSPDVLLRQRLAEARVALAIHLLADRPNPDDRRQATNLVHAASTWYRGAGAGYAWRIPELVALADRAALQ